MAAKDETQARTAKPRRSRAKTAAKSPAEVAQTAFDAVAAKVVDAIISLWSPDGVQDWVAIGIRRGHDEIRQMFEEIFAATPDFGIVVERIVGDDESACVQWRSSGTLPKSW